MSGGYTTTAGEGLGPLLQTIDEIRRRLSELEIPTGTSMSSLVAKVNAKLAELDATVSSLVTAAIAANSYTKSEIDSKIASPGTIAPTTVNMGGEFYSPTARANPVVTSYVSAYLNSDGRLGATPSSRALKDHIEFYDVPESAWSLRPVVFTYKDDPLQTPRLGFYAEDADAVDPLLAVHEEGEPYSLHDRALIAALWGMVTNLNGRVAAIEGQSQ